MRTRLLLAAATVSTVRRVVSDAGLVSLASPGASGPPTRGVAELPPAQEPHAPLGAHKAVRSARLETGERHPLQEGAGDAVLSRPQSGWLPGGPRAPGVPVHWTPHPDAPRFAEPLTLLGRLVHGLEPLVEPFALNRLGLGQEFELQCEQDCRTAYDQCVLAKDVEMVELANAGRFRKHARKKSFWNVASRTVQFQQEWLEKQRKICKRDYEPFDSRDPYPVRVAASIESDTLRRKRSTCQARCDELRGREKHGLALKIEALTNLQEALVQATRQFFAEVGDEACVLRPEFATESAAPELQQMRKWECRCRTKALQVDPQRAAALCTSGDLCETEDAEDGQQTVAGPRCQFERVKETLGDVGADHLNRYLEALWAAAPQSWDRPALYAQLQRLDAAFRHFGAGAPGADRWSRFAGPEFYTLTAVEATLGFVVNVLGHS